DLGLAATDFFFFAIAIAPLRKPPARSAAQLGARECLSNGRRLPLRVVRAAASRRRFALRPLRPRAPAWPLRVSKSFRPKLCYGESVPRFPRRAPRATLSRRRPPPPRP